MIRVVVGILQREEKILIAERPSGKPYSGYFEFPGGKIEENELAYDALTRELYEELGITVITAVARFQHSHSYPDKTVLLEIWRVLAFSGEPYSKENQTLLWATHAQLRTLRLLDGNMSILDKL